MVPDPIPITVIHKSLKRKQIWGECDEATRTIWVERKHPNSQALLGTLLHGHVEATSASSAPPKKDAVMDLIETAVTEAYAEG